MKKLITLLLLVATRLSAQDIRAVTATDIVKYASSVDTVYVINFWATWCLPCVQELPVFNKIQEKFAAEPVKVLLVSLDFRETYPFQLQGFVKRKRLAPEVVWLSETDPNVFIPRLEPSWQGSIPATIVVRPGRDKKFVEGSVSYGQVVKMVNGMR